MTGAGIYPGFGFDPPSSKQTMKEERTNMLRWQDGRLQQAWYVMTIASDVVVECETVWRDVPTGP